MLVSEDRDSAVVHIARGAPRRWYSQTAEPFGIEDAPTRFGKVTYELQALSNGSVRGSIAVVLNEGAEVPMVAVKIRAPDKAKPLRGHLVFDDDGDSTVTAWHAANETALIRFGQKTTFNFTAS